MDAAPLKNEFRKRFSREAEVSVRAPGRLEILGNHTDYNEGVVLSAAVDLATTVCAAKTAGTTCRVFDVVANEERNFDLGDLDNPTHGDWGNYIKGMVVELNRRGIEVPAFDATFGSTIPRSAGMSSSAAIEMSFGKMMLALAGKEIEWRELAKAGQACENNYVGANSGLLDQFSSLMGQKDQLVYSDFRSLDIKTIPLPDNIALVVANSMVKHDLSDHSEDAVTYNSLRADCERATEILAGKYPGVKALRDVSLEQLEGARETLDSLSYRRALHVVGECTRVETGINLLDQGDVAAFGQLMFESQDSSTYNFENSCEELDKLVAAAKGIPGGYGARLSGGGFGGITVHLVDVAQAEAYAEELVRRYQDATGIEATTVICRPGNGARIL